MPSLHSDGGGITSNGSGTLSVSGNIIMTGENPLGEIVAQELYVQNGTTLDGGGINTDGSGNLTAASLNADNGFTGSITTLTGVATFVNGICTGYTGS